MPPPYPRSAARAPCRLTLVAALVVLATAPGALAGGQPAGPSPAAGLDPTGAARSRPEPLRTQAFGSPDPHPGTYVWPVVGPVIRGFDPPETTYGPGHRGIDIAAPFGTPVRAAQEGRVAFAGWVGGSLYVSIDHPDGVRTTYSWISAAGVQRGQAVARGEVIGSSGRGHPGAGPPHLHFGARIGDVYIDPMILLGGGSVAGLIHLAPLPP